MAIAPSTATRAAAATPSAAPASIQTLADKLFSLLGVTRFLAPRKDAAPAGPTPEQLAAMLQEIAREQRKAFLDQHAGKMAPGFSALVEQAPPELRDMMMWQLLKAQQGLEAAAAEANATVRLTPAEPGWVHMQGAGSKEMVRWLHEVGIYAGRPEVKHTTTGGVLFRFTDE